MEYSLEEISAYNHKALLEMQKKGYGYVFIKTKSGDIKGETYNYENSEELEKLAIDTPNGKLYPLKIEL